MMPKNTFIFNFDKHVSDILFDQGECASACACFSGRGHVFGPCDTMPLLSQ